MKDNYIRQQSEVTGKHTVFTEIEINAAPELVRSKFLDFEKWGAWCKVIPEISIKSGDINDLSTKPTISLTLDFGGKKDPTKAPVSPKVRANSEEVFDWGFSLGFLLKAHHVFIFEPLSDGKTRLVHYEQMQGMLKSLVMKESVRKSMSNRYSEMNESLKTLCETSS